MTTLDGSVVLITGANGGLGREFVRQALARGARTVYATARTPVPGTTSGSCRSPWTSPTRRRSPRPPAPPRTSRS
ncbi:MAG: KR domain-containing protein [Nakamurella multipartita]